MLSQYAINEFTKRAKAAGLSDDQIQQEIEKKAREIGGNGGSIPQPTGNVPTAQQSTAGVAGATPQQGAAQQQSGGFIAQFINNLVQPALDYGKFVGEAGYQASRYVVDPVFRKAINGEQLTPQEAAQLDPNKDTLFVDKNKIADAGAIATTGAKATAGAMSYAIPFGKGASLASKVLIPGAVSGALNEASRQDATPGSVVESGVTGAATAGVFHAIGGAFSWLKGKSGAVNQEAAALQEGTRKIKVPASIFGAEQEKAINQTLDRYGFSGTAQQQYEKLQPTMDTIEKQIQQVVKDNPKLGANVEDIKKSFMDELASSLRTRDITKPQAQKEINNYLTDVLRAAGGLGEGETLLKSGNKDIPLATLREMKRIINQDMNGIFDKLAKGKDLNSTEKVTAAAWTSLDNAVKSASPELKALLKDESNLYKAAGPLSAARSNPPTFRAAGFSVPARVTQGLRDLGSGTLKKLGIGLEKLPQGGMLQQDQLLALAALTPQAMKEKGLSEQDIQKVTDITQGLQQQQGFEPGQNPAADINGQPMDMQSAGQPQTLDPFGGLSKRQVLALALSNGASTKDLEEVGKIYDMLGADTGTVSAETQQVADSLRTEYFKRTQENNFVDAANAYQKVIASSPTPEGDISLIFAYMKMLDPNSVVREGEFATAQNAGGIPDVIINKYNNALKGDKLNDHQRAAFKAEAGKVFSVYQQRQAPIDAYYQGLAKRYGIDPSLVGVGLYQSPNQSQ